MRQFKGKLIVAAGVVLAVVGLLAFSLGSPGVTIGQEVDTGLPTDVAVPEDGAGGDVGAGAAEPPASLPQSGTGGMLEAGGSTEVLLAALLAALGVTLTGAGVIAARHGRRVRGQ